METKVQSIPEAKLLLSSLRSVGYNEETAIADIIDNCISAQAHEIKIRFDWEKKRIVISDDGFGMSETELVENMRIGSSDPSKIRAEDDLGRFGMGMKTAAFSLGKKLTVVTKSNFAVSNASWDLDQIPEIGWNLIIRDESEISEFSSQMGEQGTIVIIENLDRVIDIDDEKKAQNKFYRIASKTEKHLALTFHRFIEEDNLILELNGTPIKAWNPFILENSATQELPEESIFSDNGCAEVTIQPYVLPHKTKFATDDDYQAAGGPKGWNYHQGVYVYRNRRLIICGTWFDYIKKEPAYNLARIKIDITSASDEDWKIDIKKSTASLPSYVRESVEREIDLCTETSARVYNSRGSYSKSNVSTPNLDYVWEQRKKNGRYSFHINRKHSLLNNIKKQLDDQGKSTLSAYLALVENFAPFMQSGVTDSLQKGKVGGESDKTSLEYQVQIKELKDIFDNHIHVDSYECTEKDGLLANIRSFAVFDYLKGILTSGEDGYAINSGVLCAADFGAPQKRERFVVMGIKKSISAVVFLPSRKIKDGHYKTVHDAIYDLEDVPPVYDLADDEEGIPLEHKEQLSSVAQQLRDSDILKNHINYCEFRC